jgi:hypothetical protein
MALSLYDYGAPGRRQKARLQSLFAAKPVTQASPQGSLYDQNIGGEANPTDIRGNSRDHRSFDSLGDYFNDPDVQKNGRALLDMITGTSPSMVGLNMATGGFAGMGPQMPAFGMRDAVADEIAEAAGGGGFSGGAGVSAADLGASLAEGNTTGMFSKGGKVTKRSLFGPNPPGPDDGFGGLKAGERVITEDDYAGFSKSTKAEIDAAMKKAAARRKR